MKLLEHQGKELLKKHGIEIPAFELVAKHTRSTAVHVPFVLKSQVLSGDRKQKGGILFVDRKEDFEQGKEVLFQTAIDGVFPEILLAEEKIIAESELYCSMSYDTTTRTPVISISKRGGSGVASANTYPVDIMWGLSDFFVRDILQQSGITLSSPLVKTILAMWKLFTEEQILLLEVNPLFQAQDGRCVAGDAKVILDDAIADPGMRPYLDLGGDIAVLASGGGASLVNLDALMHYGGRPANYVEYSGNPPASVVDELTNKVFSKPGLKGCWVVGGTANFTDIYETMLGFVQGLRKVQPKPAIPIVIRRDGPRQKEAFAMLKEVGEKEGYDFHLFGPETPMSESAKIIVELAYTS
ncbi:MAG: hypothetical protein HYV78_00315 [Candidatus Wildermuthbacteria bacterium]|nr:hypothetical protein [Candidatus Wildermuthbacteria bacterium]